MSVWSLIFCQELKELKRRRVAAFKKNLAELAELQMRHSRVSAVSLIDISFARVKKANN